MCGHVGIMGKHLHAPHEDMIQDGLQVCTLRGMDSVGWAVVPVDKKEAPYVQKRCGCPPVFLKLPDKGAKVCIGHVRSATIGGRNDRDLAHPFAFDNILGAHNGTLRGDWRKVLQEGTNEVFGSDSQGVFYNFAYWGVEETIKRLEGAWCFVWWDDDEGTLNLLRNDERPLWTAKGASGNLYWASEHWMIGAMLRQGEKDRDKLVKTPNAKGEERFFHKLPSNMWRRYHFDDQGGIVQRDDIPLEGAPPSPALVKEVEEGGPWSYMSYENGEWVAADEKTPGSFRVAGLTPSNSDGTKHATSKGKLWRNVAGIAYVCKPGQNEITFRELLELTDGCCAECGQFINDPVQIGYLPDDYSWISCTECCKDWDGRSWDYLLDAVNEDASPAEIDALIKKGAEDAGKTKRNKPANDGPTELGKAGPPPMTDVQALLALDTPFKDADVFDQEEERRIAALIQGNPELERFAKVNGYPNYDRTKPLEHGWKYVLRNKDGTINWRSGCKTKAQMDIYSRKMKTCKVEIVATDELDRVCFYVPAPTPELPVPPKDDLNDRIPPSLLRARPVLQLPPSTSEWPKKKALPEGDDVAF